MGLKNFFLKKEQNLSDLFTSQTFKKNFKISDIKPLGEASKNDLTFYDSKKYRLFAKKTKAKYCLTTQNLAEDLPISTEKIIVKNVLVELAKISKKIYPYADIDYPDYSLKKPIKHFESYGYGSLCSAITFAQIFDPKYIHFWGCNLYQSNQENYSNLTNAKNYYYGANLPFYSNILLKDISELEKSFQEKGVEFIFNKRVN